jgi:hypothetical protein
VKEAKTRSCTPQISSYWKHLLFGRAEINFMSSEATHKTNHWLRASLLVMPRFTTIVANDPSIANYYFLLSLNIGSNRSNSSISRNLRNRLCNRIILLLLFFAFGVGTVSVGA